MEWPAIEILSSSSSLSLSSFSAAASEAAILLDEETLDELRCSVVVREIYTRAATTSLSETVAMTIQHPIDHQQHHHHHHHRNYSSNGWRDRVESFLHNDLSQVADREDWASRGYRDTARSFCELAAGAPDRARTLALCRGGLEAVHDLMRYKLPERKTNNHNNTKTNNNHKNKIKSASQTANLLAAKDAFVLSQSFPKLGTATVTGTRAPDLGFRLGLLMPHAVKRGNAQGMDSATSTATTPIAGAGAGCFDYDESSFFGSDALRTVQNLYERGAMEASAVSLAKHTLANPKLVSKLANTLFVVLGCDHSLSPVKTLLRIPGVEVLGIPSSARGLADVVDYARYNSPDDTSLVYPVCKTKTHPPRGGRGGGGGGGGRGGGGGGGHEYDYEYEYDYDYDDNLILSKGPQVAQWILDRTRRSARHELVLVPMPLPLPQHANIHGSGETAVPESAVRWAAASDLIVQRVLGANANANANANAGNSSSSSSSKTPSKQCSLWSYQSPTTCMVVPPASTTKSTERLRERPSHEQWLHSLSRGSVLTPVSEAATAGTMMATTTATTTAASSTPAPAFNHEYSIVNGIVTSEGPHHVLAEQIRMWRAMLTHHGNSDGGSFFSGYGYDSEYDSEYDDDDESNYRNSAVPVFAPYVPLLADDPSTLTNFTNNHSNNSHTYNNANANANDANANNDPWCRTPMPALTAASLMAAIALAGHTDPLVHRPVMLLEGYDDDEDDIGLPHMHMHTLMHTHMHTHTHMNTQKTEPYAYRLKGTTPFAMFWNGSVHSGVWNAPYTLESIRGTMGFFLKTAYEYYRYYYYEQNSQHGASPAAARAGGGGGGSFSQSCGADNTESCSSLSATAGSSDRDGSHQGSIVDVVPSSMRDEVRSMPDLVKERLELLA